MSSSRKRGSSSHADSRFREDDIQIYDNVSGYRIFMHIAVDTNPNCQGSEEFVFNELEIPRKIKGIRISEGTRDVDCEVAGVDGKGRFIDAFAAKITDSGAGFAYLIYGSDWGIRIRPSIFSNEPWSFSNPRQWGEPFKIYGSEADIIYG